MSGVIKTVFGGSTSKSQSKSNEESGNIFANLLSDKFGGVADQAGQASRSIADLLGLTGNGEQAAAQANFRETPGYQFARDEGLNGVAQRYAGTGAYESGAAMKGLQRFGTGLADQTYKDYLASLYGLTDAGLNAGKIISDAGRYSKGSSTSTGSSSTHSGGLGKALGFGMGAG